MFSDTVTALKRLLAAQEAMHASAASSKYGEPSIDCCREYDAAELQAKEMIGKAGIGGMAMTPVQRVERIEQECTGSDLSSWERFEFLPSVKQRNGLSEKQEKVLRGIEKRVFGEREE